MKKVAIVIVLALVGGGAYLYFQKPDTFKEYTEKITDQVEKLIAGSDFEKLEKYGKEFTKRGLEEAEDKDEYIGNLADSYTTTNYLDPDGGRVILGNDGKDAQVLFFTFPETAEGIIVTLAKENWKHFFEEEQEFLESGDVESEYAIGSWKTADGKTEILIHRKDLEVLPAVEDMEQDVQKAISDFRGVVKTKVSMEEKWDELDDEKNFCFDKNRYNEIVSDMDDLKKQAEELTKKAKELIAKIPAAQVALIRKELDGASLE